MTEAAPHSQLMKVAAFIQLGRLKFLLYTPILYGLGAATALGTTRQVDPRLYFFGLAVVWVTHVMTHYCNEYFDYDADVANTQATPFTGGSRVLVQGLLARSVAIRAAVALTAISALMMLALPTIAAKIVCGAAIALAWGYSAPPVRLVGRGLGELTVVTVLNVLTPLFGCVMQLGLVSGRLFAVALPLGIIGYARMLVMSIPDREGDAAAGKRTLAVRFGPEAVVRLHNVGMIVAYGSLPALLAVGLPWPVPAAIGVTAPLALWQGMRLASGAWMAPAMLRSIPFWASTHNALAALMALIGFLIARSPPPSSLIVELFPACLYGAFFGYFWLTSRRPR
jgi:1,4-dihydroxy-2-naphthoate octaprenyltransferase